MKKMAIILFTVCIAVMSAFTIRKALESGVHGMVSPADGATLVWATGDKDSVSVVPVAGNFSINLKPGKWRLHVVSIAPYKDAFVENVQVEDGKFTDVGEIKLKSSTH